MLVYLHLHLGLNLIVGRDCLFALEVKVQGFAFKDSDGRESYCKDCMIKWDVEYLSLTLEMLVSSISDELKLHSNQLPTLWFFDKRLHEDVRLVSEIQMLDIFEMYKEEMSCQIIVGAFDKLVCSATEFDELQPLCVLPNNDFTIPNEPSSAAPEISEAAVELEAPEKPEVAADLEPDREPDIFDNPEEYVGIDDEQIYTAVPDAQPAQPVHHTHNFADGQPCDENTFTHANDDEVDDADPLEVHVLHDAENPNIVRGALFPDIIAFRKAIRHHAVKIEFEFARVKTDKTRFIEHCAAKGCPWRIHASTIFDKKTIKVTYLDFYRLCVADKLVNCL